MFHIFVVLLLALFAAGCASNRPQVIQKPDREIVVRENCRRLSNGEEFCKPVQASTPAENECYGAHPTDPEARRHCLVTAQGRNNREAIRQADPDGYQKYQQGHQTQRQNSGGFDWNQMVPPFMVPYMPNMRGF